MTSRILASLLLLSLIFFSGCGGNSPLALQTVQAASPFGGRYLFRAEMHVTGTSTPPNFVEGGILTVDSSGGFVLISTYNATPLNTVPSSPITSPNIHINGAYTFDSRGFGVMASTGATDAFSSPAHFYCRHDGSYCTVESAEAGRPWQGKMWRDDSSATLSTAAMSGSYIFESDSSQNFFSESGVLVFDGAGKFTLQSAFNNTFPGSIIGPPDQVWACGEYSADSNSGHLTQRFCHDNSVTDTTAFYCFNDASRCVGIPDLVESGSWIMEFQRQ